MNRGFTLIEISIVLVVIGLIIGGILVGQDLISAAAVRSQISQIEKYNTAVNTFKSKYNKQLPGDMDAQTASMFGFTPRTTVAWFSPTNRGLGDGNGVIEGNNYYGGPGGLIQSGGETLVFWQDLAQAGLIDGGFTAVANTSTQIATSSIPTIAQYFPAAKLGGGNFVYVWSGGYNFAYGGSGVTDNTNYFGISVITNTNNAGWGAYGTAGMTVAQANAIDTKMDDGLPQYGNVLAIFLSTRSSFATWAANTNFGGDYWNWYIGGMGDAERNGMPIGPSDGAGTAQGPYSCYDMSSGGGYEKYSMGYKNGSGLNCGLSFKFQ